MSEEVHASSPLPAFRVLIALQCIQTGTFVGLTGPVRTASRLHIHLDNDTMARISYKDTHIIRCLILSQTRGLC
jgi:hypothetical protein